MADYNTHTYFGMRVLEELPLELRRFAVRDLTAFRLGLYGPDPLLFDLRSKRQAEALHQAWRRKTMPQLTRAMEKGTPTEGSFAAGCVLHLLLDDVVHPWIHGWEGEGASHFRLELALDQRIVREQGLEKMPRLLTQGRDRTAQAAAALLPGVSAARYRSGLGNMGLVVAYLRQWGERHTDTLTEAEHRQVGTLRRLVEEAIQPAAEELASLLGRKTVTC